MNFSQLGWALLAALPLTALTQVNACGGDDDDDDATAQPPQYTLGQSLRISYDQVGVPHIYGASTMDVVFGQGYVTARDRLWQMDYLRRQGTGRLAELFGEGSYNSDLMIRTLGIPGLAQQAYDALRQNDPQTAELLDAYAAGVNAYLAAAKDRRDGASLPQQIEALGYVPEPWQPTDSLAIDKLLSYGSSAKHLDETMVWMVGKLLGPEVMTDMLRPRPPQPAYIVPGFYDDKASSPAKATPLARPGTGSVLAPKGKEQAPVWQPPGDLERAQLLDALDRLHSYHFFDWMSGSNNWVVSGEYTASGYPIVANDTHQGVEAPPTYYEVHLNTAAQGGNLDVVGYGYAGLPLILFGHNQRAAIGLTLNMADVSDVYQETVVGDSVLFKGQLVPLEIHTETIRVRADGGAVADAAPRTITVRKVPHHGPILPAELLGDIPVTLSAAWTGYNPSSLFQVLTRLCTMDSFEDIREALNGLVAGAVNVVYGDIDGNIGYSGRSDVPIREQLDPAHPPYMVLPGTGGYEWTGRILPDDLVPWVKNPAAGFIGSANNDPAGLLEDNDALNGPYIDAIGSNVYLSAIYDIGLRAWRIADMIQAEQPRGGLTLEDSMRWQADTRSQLAARTLPYLLEAARRRPDLVTGTLADAVEYLQAFEEDNYRCTVGSSGCLIYHAWLAYVIPGIFGDETDPALMANLDNIYLQIYTRPLFYFLDATADMVDALDFQAGGGCKIEPTNPLCDAVFPSATGLNYFDNQDTADKVETRDETLLAALSRAVGRIEGYAGSLEALLWGDVHQIRFSDPAEWSGHYPDATLGPYAIDGGFFTVDVADGRLSQDGEFSFFTDVWTAPSQRTVFELDPAGIRSWDVLPGGQSERVGEAHHADQLELYLTNQARGLPFYPADVAAAQEAELSLPLGFPQAGSPSWK